MLTLITFPTLDEIIGETIDSLEDQRGILLAMALTTDIVDWCQCRGQCTCGEFTEAFLTLEFRARFIDDRGNRSVGGGRSQIGSWNTLDNCVTDWRDNASMRSEVPSAIAEILTAESVRRDDIITVLRAIATSNTWEIPEGF